MILEMKIPSPGESISEVEIATWLVKNGDYVEKDQIIAEIESDKATLELAAEKEGIITLKVNAHDIVPVGTIVCLIDTSTNNSKNNIHTNEDNLSNNKKLSLLYSNQLPSPAAGKIIKEKNINLESIEGSGKNGRIIKEDVLNINISMGDIPISGNRNQKIIKLSSLRKKLASRLISVKNKTAMLTTFNDIDMSEVFMLRKKYKETFIEKHNVNLGFMSFFTKAVILALKQYPNINSMIDGENHIFHEFYDISIAVSGPKGLTVPVIRNAENLTFRGIEKTVQYLANKVREGKITIDEMTGGTFTITNGGTFGSMLSTPIINPPQTGILGMHNIIDRPIVKNKEIIIRPMMYIALSYDHQVIDGKEAVSFLISIKESIENPIKNLMNNNIKKALEL